MLRDLSPNAITSNEKGKNSVYTCSLHAGWKKVTIEKKKTSNFLLLRFYAIRRITKSSGSYQVCNEVDPTSNEPQHMTYYTMQLFIKQKEARAKPQIIESMPWSSQAKTGWNASAGPEESWAGANAQKPQRAGAMLRWFLHSGTSGQKVTQRTITLNYWFQSRFYAKLTMVNLHFYTELLLGLVLLNFPALWIQDCRTNLDGLGE